MESDFAAMSRGDEDNSTTLTLLLPATHNGAAHSRHHAHGVELDHGLGITNIEYLDEATEGVMQTQELQVPDALECAQEPYAEEDAEVATLARAPTQVPKKRRDAALLAAVSGDLADAADEEEEEEEQDLPDDMEKLEVNNTEDDDEGATTTTTAAAATAAAADQKPSSSTRAAAALNRENNVEEDQCRVCTTKDDLVSLFKKVEKLTVAEMLMIICPSVSIARKDFMPQYICNTCLDNVTIAVQFKNQCESTEKELRKKLSRSKNKVRRPTGFTIIDAPIESDPPSDEEPKSDVEFKMSDVEVSASGDGDSSQDSDFALHKKKRTTRGAGARRGRRKSAITPTIKAKRGGGASAAVRRTEPESSADEQRAAESAPPPAKKKKRKHPVERVVVEPPPKQTEFPCDECEQVFTRKLSLVLHKKAHSGGREPINCEVCGKQFKIQGAYRSHLEKHKEDTAVAHNCSKCSRSFISKTELRRHIADVHEDVSVFFTCEKCKRVFTTEQRLQRHKEHRCPGFEVKQPRKDVENFTVGKDLFKSVAPLTTTYWSDSFSD